MRPIPGPRPAPGLLSRLVALLLLVSLAAALGEVAARLLLEHRIARAVAKAEPGATDVTSGVGFPVLPRLLAGGRLGRVSASARNVNLSLLTADQVSAAADGVHVDVGAALAGGRAVVTHIDRIDLTLTITEAEASAILPPGFTFTFGDGTVTLHALVAPISGRFSVEPPGRVVFSFVGSPLEGIRVPDIKFGVHPLDTCLQSIVLRPGTLTITCRENNPSTDLLPHP